MPIVLNMEELQIYNPKKKIFEKEKIYKEGLLIFLYGKKSFFALALKFFIAKSSLCSFVYAFFQKTKFSKKKIEPFVKSYQIDLSESEKTLEEFESFNDFFIRKLKPTARVIDPNPKLAISPVDGRALVFQDLSVNTSFYVKGQTLSLKELFADDELAGKYSDGSMALVRLSPVDYHRFHFPFDCFAHVPKLIPGHYYSVNPLALKNDLSILCKNKRMITLVDSECFGRVLFLEIGATFVGTIHQTFVSDHLYAKGEEKGYFSFGGSTVILVFEKNKILFEKDLIYTSSKNVETLIRFGDRLGKTLN